MIVVKDIPKMHTIIIMAGIMPDIHTAEKKGAIIMGIVSDRRAVNAYGYIYYSRNDDPLGPV